jgi:tRNA-binding EMAP/Myf-like protein
MESVPSGKVEVVSAAVLLRPPPGVRNALPIVVAPLIKVTEPVGASSLQVTVAVSVVDWP